MLFIFYGVVSSGCCFRLLGVVRFFLFLWMAFMDGSFQISQRGTEFPARFRARKTSSGDALSSDGILPRPFLCPAFRQGLSVSAIPRRNHAANVVRIYRCLSLQPTWTSKNYVCLTDNPQSATKLQSVIRVRVGIVRLSAGWLVGLLQLWRIMEKQAGRQDAGKRMKPDERFHGRYIQCWTGLSLMTEIETIVRQKEGGGVLPDRENNSVMMTNWCPKRAWFFNFPLSLQLK